ncbi:hypothetical protein N7495_003596 [Penicillium taxi]|uniref:uncharacterized protein n=1 Tax=Penicillium taxi TaxID=168475 RepID=UPI0025450BC0|nr:uncharacterized protein N7495_003596 [Penicillium taxi]KAJ5898852.1 hypothetical protein N7495_003596 [Penicillium taxi]
MQSMAAACVNEKIPQIKSISVHLRGEATRILRREIGNIRYDTNAITFQELFLACFMLGLSSAWHDSRDLGLVYFEAAQWMVTELLDHPRTLSASEQQCASFCKKGLIYWQMLTVAMKSENSVDSGLQRGYSLRMSQDPMILPPFELTLPHPFTGLADVAQELIANAIALTKQPQTPENLKIAFDLEERLLSVDIPTRDDIQDTLDDQSPNWHFSLVAEAYKNTGLLHLYKSFRPLVECRLKGVGDEGQSAEDWLASFAVFILNILSQIPPSSGTRCTQPLAIVISAAALKFPKRVYPSDPSSSNGDVDTLPLGADIMRSRTFVMDRLQCYERSLPPKPITTAIKLVNEVWRQIDEGRNVGWMDVMVQNSLQSIFG